MLRQDVVDKINSDPCLLERLTPDERRVLEKRLGINGRIFETEELITLLLVPAATIDALYRQAISKMF